MSVHFLNPLSDHFLIYMSVNFLIRMSDHLLNMQATRAITTEYAIRNGKIKNKEYFETMRKNLTYMTEMRDFVFSTMMDFPRVENVIRPEACYYMLIKLRYSEGSLSFFKKLLEAELVNVVPGIIFGLPEKETWIRLCFARSKKLLEKGMDKIFRFTGNGSFR